MNDDDLRSLAHHLFAAAPPPPPEGVSSGDLRSSILALNEDARRAADGPAWTAGLNYTEGVNGVPNTVAPPVPNQTRYVVPRVLLEGAFLTEADVPHLTVTD